MNIHRGKVKEVFEETGITCCEIEHLELRYILMRRNKKEIRQHYIYIGRTSKEAVNTTDEGELHWLAPSDILNLEMPLTVKHMLHHFFSNPNEQEVIIGTVNGSQMEWSCLVD
jgi:8-oxo-dGTP diphosphatase